MSQAIDSPESVGMSSRRLERIQPAMQAYVDRGVYAGVSTLIARRGTIVHAELTFGNAMIMLGSARDDEYGRLVKPPTDPGDSNTQSPYIVVQDADRHYARAVAAGATIVMDLKDEDYGGRGYSCRDPEGHLWNFGTYDPWAPAKPS